MKTGKRLIVLFLPVIAGLLIHTGTNAATEQRTVKETEDYHIEWIAVEQEDHQVTLRVGDYYTSSGQVELEVPRTVGDLTVTKLSDDAFEGGFDSIVQITLPDTVTEIGARAFKGCTALKRISLPAELSVIGEEAFADCENLSRVFLPEKVKSIGAGAFSGTALKGFRLSSGNSKYRITDGVLFDAKGTTLLCYPAGKEDQSYRIPEGTVTVADRAFAGCRNLARIFVSDTLTTLEEAAFADCSSLHYCRISAGLVNIGADAFRGTAITRFIVDGDNKKLKSVDGALFRNGELVAYPPAKDDTLYILPEDTSVIGKYAFRGNPYLQEAVLPEGLHWIGEGAFCGCSALKKVRIPASVSEFGARVFEDCSRLREVRFHPGTEIGSIYEYAFHGCTWLEEIRLPESVTYLGLYAFAGCKRLARVSLPENLAMISDGAFEDCRSLKTLTIPRNVDMIGKDVFTKKPEKLTVYSDTPALHWARRQGISVEVIKEPVEVMERTDSISLITKVQAVLNAWGYDCGKPDGKVGRKTRAAIAAFRKDFGLDEGEEIDAQLLKALGL